MNEMEDQPELEATESAETQAAAPSHDLERLSRLVEALLLAADQPLSLDALVKLLAPDAPIGRRELRLALERLEQRLADSAAELREVASGWRIQVKADYAEVVARLWQEKPPKLTRALLETLALICYRQPITRGEIEEIRGVAVSPNILKNLLERGWIREVGVRETPGRPSLFGTAPQLLDDLGLRSLDQLPSLPEIKDMEQLEAALSRLAGQPLEIALAESGDEAGEQPGAPLIETDPPTDVTIH